MFFKDIIGQDEIKKRLIKSAIDGRVSHAQLLLGPEGCGNLALAIAFAQYLNCESPQETDSCGQCSSCTKAHKLIHPDIHFSYPIISKKTEGKTLSTSYINEWRSAIQNNPYLNTNQWFKAIDAENKQGNIPIAECNDILKKLSLKAFESRNKILLMWMPEYLGPAGNVLLKILEEPPENTYFLLVSENQDAIINTILSRLQLLKLNRLQEDQITEALVNGQDINNEEAARISRLVSGNYNEALHMCDYIENNNEKLLLEWVDNCMNNRGESQMDWIEEFAIIGRENQKNFLKYALHFFRECMVIKYGGLKDLRMEVKERELAAHLAQTLSIDQIDKIYNLLNRSTYYIERNAHPKITLLQMSIQISKIFQNKEVILADSY